MLTLLVSCMQRISKELSISLLDEKTGSRLRLAKGRRRELLARSAMPGSALMLNRVPLRGSALFKAMNNEPSLFFSGVFGVGIIAVPALLYLTTSDNGGLDVTDKRPWVHRYSERTARPNLDDAEKIMRFYQGKGEYR